MRLNFVSIVLAMFVFAIGLPSVVLAETDLTTAVTQAQTLHSPATAVELSMGTQPIALSPVQSLLAFEGTQKHVSVMTGVAQCDLGQQVSLQEAKANPGHFMLNFNNKQYLMTVQLTSTGSIKLINHKNHLMWLQVPQKSMLMNSKLGQRLLDNCKIAQVN